MAALQQGATWQPQPQTCMAQDEVQAAGTCCPSCQPPAAEGSLGPVSPHALESCSCCNVPWLPLSPCTPRDLPHCSLGLLLLLRGAWVGALGPPGEPMGPNCSKQPHLGPPTQGSGPGAALKLRPRLLGVPLVCGGGAAALAQLAARVVALLSCLALGLSPGRYTSSCRRTVPSTWLAPLRYCGTAVGSDLCLPAIPMYRGLGAGCCCNPQPTHSTRVSEHIPKTGPEVSEGLNSQPKISRPEAWCEGKPSPVLHAHAG